MKNQKGVTLIALVITIIVLIILAAVSIAMLTGENGILTEAKNAKTSTNDSTIADKINMELNAFKADILEKKLTYETYNSAAKSLGNYYIFKAGSTTLATSYSNQDSFETALGTATELTITNSEEGSKEIKGTIALKDNGETKAGRITKATY